MTGFALTLPAVRMTLACALVVLGGALVVLRANDIRRDRASEPRSMTLRRVLGAGTAGLVAVGAPAVPSPSVTLPVVDVVAPAVALSVLRRILSTRRRQAGDRSDRRRPRRLTHGEIEVLRGLVKSAATVPAGSGSLILDERDLPPVVRGLLTATEERTTGVPSAVPHDWSVLVRLAGEPVVENRHGARAHFSKKRSVELLSWMVLNRDRSTRSAARNALWDISVADSTFSTVVSDLRRGLSRLVQCDDTTDWSPVTYCDDLPLAPGVVTDVDLLDSAAASGDPDSLRRALSLVRDIPFAGTSYLWADLDGSTTRIILSVMAAVECAVTVARRNDDRELLSTAVRAGLRVMPGDEELLSIQKESLRC